MFCNSVCKVKMNILFYKNCLKILKILKKKLKKNEAIEESSFPKRTEKEKNYYSS